MESTGESNAPYTFFCSCMNKNGSKFKSQKNLTSGLDKSNQSIAERPSPGIHKTYSMRQ